MNKKLNGFNNGRDTIDGVGGKEAVFKCFGCKCTPCCTPEVCEKAVLESIKNQLGLGKQLQRPETFTINTEKPSISVKEAIEILCNALREDRNQINAFQSTMRTTKKLEILKTIANSMKIDWDIVKENEQIISLNLKPIIK